MLCMWKTEGKGEIMDREGEFYIEEYNIYGD
jgi:hypothetical protein